MRGRRWWWLAGVVMLLAVGLGVMWIEGSRSRNEASQIRPVAGLDQSAKELSPPVVSSVAPVDPQRATTLSRSSDGLVIWPGAAEISQTLNQPDQSARDDLQTLHTILGNYHMVFGEVPEGGLNEEITRGLLGENSQKIVFLTAKPGELSATGELLDRWRTPYFFHKLSHDVIDLRSAGPDRKFWTPDDIFDESSASPPL